MYNNKSKQNTDNYRNRLKEDEIKWSNYKDKNKEYAKKFIEKQKNNGNYDNVKYSSLLCYYKRMGEEKLKYTLLKLKSTKPDLFNKLSDSLKT